MNKFGIFRLSEADRRESFEEYDELSRDSDDMTVEETRKCQIKFKPTESIWLIAFAFVLNGQF